MSVGNEKNKGKVLVAMSGGVDSSVAAALLVREGYEVVGCFMRLGSPGETVDELVPIEEDGQCDRAAGRRRGCCSVGDAHDAKLVAAELDIPLYVCNFRDDFGRIMDYFVEEHRLGRTPNPCVRCNDWLKFGKLHAYAKQIGAKFVASGHHARLVRNGSSTELWRGADRAKDQSYVLFGAPRSRLDEMLLPVGEYAKDEVRAMAEQMGLPVFDKPDSQEICFVPDNDHAKFVEGRAPELVREGDILDAAGAVLGRHDGHHRFTIGQRRGVGVSIGLPLYVVAKDTQANTITVGSKEDLVLGSLTVDQVNWLVGEDERASLEGAELEVQFRAHGTPAKAQLVMDSQGENLEIRFAQPQFGVAAGQAVVCYGNSDFGRVLGGGWIKSANAP